MIKEPIKYTGITENKEYLLDILDKAVVFGDLEIRVRKWNDQRAKSESQNNTFHDLLAIFDEHDEHSFENKEELKDYYKNKVGLVAGYIYNNGDCLKKEKNIKDIPSVFRNKKDASKILDSWSNATIKQGKEAITFLIKDMLKACVNSDKFHRMLDDFSEKQRKYYGVNE